jgi:osmotically inducible lipoprotein OsmB
MQMVKLTAALAVVVALAGCLQNDAQRGVAGAVGGGAIAGATGGDVATGALIGGAAGVFCRDLNVPGCRNE